MTRRLNYLALLVGAISTSGYCANYAADARGEAMGGVGVVAASYLTAPFYNPALTAIYRRSDDAGMLIPGVGASYDDSDKLIDTIDKVVSSSDPNAPNELNGKTLNARVGAAVAVGIPNSYASMNVFAKVYDETFVTPEILSGDIINSSVTSASVSMAEAGVSIAKYSHYLGQHIAVGISPKLQRAYTFIYNERIDSFNLFSSFDNQEAETLFNLDAGAMWFYGPIRVGFSAMNLIARDISTKTIKDPANNDVAYQYKLEPQYTVGAGFVFDYAMLSVDYEISKDEKFVGLDDDTQMLRIGGEIDIMRQLKIRAGYNMNMAYSDSEPTYTAGLGISPLGLIQIDVSVSYSNSFVKGAYVNFLNTF